MNKFFNFQFSVISVRSIFLVLFIFTSVIVSASFIVNAEDNPEPYVQNNDATASEVDSSPKSTLGGNVPKSTLGGNVPKSTLGGNVVPESNIFTLQNPLKVDSIGELLQSVIQIFTYLVIIFAVLMLIWTGFQYVVVASQGDTNKISELHNRLKWLVIGIAIVIGARVIVEVVINTLSATGAISPGVIDSANSASRAIQGK